MIRPMTVLDANSVLKIYEFGILTGNATFQTDVPSWQDFDADHLPKCRYVFERNDQVIAWIALSPVSKRACYRGVAEVSVYVADGHFGKGIASNLMKRVIHESTGNNIWTLYSSIFPENIATYNLHIKHGFRRIGYRENIAKHLGKWRDTIIMECRLDYM